MHAWRIIRFQPEGARKSQEFKMHILTSARYSLSVCAAILLAACSAGNIPASAPLSGGPAASHRVIKNLKEAVLYSFAGGSDGANPQAGLVKLGDMLYGTTYEGGTGSYGTIFAITTSGTESMLYSFQGGSDGMNRTGSPDQRRRHAIRHDRTLRREQLRHGLLNHAVRHRDAALRLRRRERRRRAGCPA